MSSAAAPYQSSTIGDVIRRSAQRYPTRVALEFGEETVPELRAQLLRFGPPLQKPAEAA